VRRAKTLLGHRKLHGSLKGNIDEPESQRLLPTGLDSVRIAESRTGRLVGQVEVNFRSSSTVYSKYSQESSKKLKILIISLFQ